MNFRHRFTNILLLAFTSGLLLYAIEVVILPRVLEPALTREQLLFGLMAIPNVPVVDVELNSMGLAGDEIAPVRDKGAPIRVLTLGGSTMFLRNMTQRIKDHLTNGHPDHAFEVLGAAFPTHDSRQSVIKYDHLRKKLRFDYVIVYHGINDLWSNNVPRKDFQDDYSHVGPFHKRTWLLDRSLLARHIYKAYWYGKRDLWRASGRVFHEINGAQFASARALAANLDTIVGQVREDGAVPILMTFAWHIPKDYSLDAFISNRLGYSSDKVPPDCCDVGVWGPLDFVATGLAKHNAAIREVARIREVVMIDQEALLSTDVQHFQDVCHFSENGADKFARTVAETIRQLSERPQNAPVTAHQSRGIGVLGAQTQRMPPPS